MRNVSWKLMLLIVACGVLWPGPGAANTQETTPPSVAYAARVERVEADGTLALDNGQEVVLRNIVFVELEQGIGLLRQLVLDKDVSVKIGAGEADRYGRWPVDIYGPVDLYGDVSSADIQPQEHQSLRHVLLSRGLVLAWPSAASAQDGAAERVARAQGAGIWRRPQNVYRCALNKDYWPAAFMIVRGRVHAIGRFDGRTYLNFEEDWRSDFTVRLPSMQEEQFLGTKAEALVGQDVEVRGWVHWSGGPMIDLEASDQLRLLGIEDEANGRAQYADAPVCEGSEG